MYRNTMFILLLILCQTALAETKTYQTDAKNPPLPTQKPLVTPLISVNPDTGKTRVFITPNNALTNGLAAHDAPVYHARTPYQATSTSLPASIAKLHQQMAQTCPRGWIKLQEWATLQSDTPELHFQFQCLTHHRTDITTP